MKSILGYMVLMVAAVMFFSSCSDDPAEPPVINVFVNGAAVSSTDPIPVNVGDRVEYRFEITAFTTIADVKMVKSVILDFDYPIKTPSEQLVGGLTQTGKEIVSGVLIADEDTEMRLVVKDVDGNEVSNAFAVLVQ